MGESVRAVPKPKAILYMDFDGVLHPEHVFWHPKHGAYLGKQCTGHELFEHVNLLGSLLEPYCDVRIVLSTSWVRQYRFSGAAKRLPEALRTRCIGATFHTGMDKRAFEDMPRGQQVIEDVMRRKPDAWLAIDDVREGWPPDSADNVVFTDPIEGIAHPAVLVALRRGLEMQFGRAQDRSCC